MALAQEDYKSYSKLVEFCNCFQNDYPISDCVRKVLQKEGDINYQFPADRRIISRDPNLASSTALHIAVIKNNVEIFETLINIGADITIQNHYGRTALHYAFLDQNIDDKKKMFIDIALSTQLRFADPSNPCDFDGISHFHIACTNNKVALVEFFLNSGIPIDSTVNVDAKRYAGYTPLHFAAEGCAIEVIKLLLKRDANMSAKEARGLTPFHVLLEEKITLMDKFGAMEKRVSNSQVVTIDDTLNQLMDSSDVDDLGLTHFHIACAMQDTSVAEYYLDEQPVDIEQQVKMNSPFRPGYTALHFAVHCNLNIAKMLIRKKANFEVRSASGLTQMDLFWQKYKLEDLRTILNDSWKYTMFSDSKTRLLDFVNCLRVDGVDMLDRYLRGLTDPTTHIKDSPTCWMGRTLLHFAVLISRDKYAIEACLRFGLDKNIDTPDINGATPVHLAFRVNKLDIVEMLIKGHPNNLVDNDGLSYLHIACALGKFDYVEKLFSFSQDKNTKSVCRGHYAHPLLKPGSTALHVAMAGAHCAIIETLANRGLSLRVTDNEGQTPLHNFLRLKQNTVDICRVLLLSNEVSDWELEEVGLTRLSMAIYCGELMVKRYATPNAVKATIKCDDPSSFLHEYDGCTPLHLAITRGANAEIVKTLLECGSDLLTLNHRGNCPLYAVLSKTYDADVVGVVLETMQTEKELRTQMVKMSGITMLHLACHVHDPVSVGWLLDRDGDTKARVKADCPVWPGDTPVHVLTRAAERGATNKQFCDTLAAIMKVNVDITAVNVNDETPIHLALRSLTAIGMYNVLTILVQNLEKFTINPLSRYGCSHFHAACLVSNVSAVKSFLKNGVDVNQPIDFFADLPGETPLHLAVEHKTEVGLGQYQAQYDIVGCLLGKGADVKAKDARGNTALHLAAATGKDPDIMELLVEHGAAIESRNIYEQTPLELLIKSNNISVERIQFFENHGCRLSVSNPLTEQGYLSMLIAQRDGACSIAIQTQCYQAVVGGMDGSVLDDMGRSLIHNIVTTNAPECQVFSHHDLIGKLQIAGVDVDWKDKTGKTALHLAAQFGNAYAVKELLQAGANINILDSNNYTAVNYAVDYYFNKKFCPRHTCHSQLVNIFVSHIRALERLRLYVNDNNIRAKRNALMKVMSNHRDFVVKEVTFDEIHRVKCTRINTTELYVGDFLSETGKGLISYPFMSHELRESVDTFFREYKNELWDVCKLQYSKAVKRVELVKLAVVIVCAIAKTIVPMDCIEIIFQYLRNDDLENLVEAKTGNGQSYGC